jgi:hypothetical protein
MRKTLLVLANERLTLGIRIRRAGEAIPEDQVDGALDAHDRDLRHGPGEANVTANVPAAHDVVGAPVHFARDHGELGHSRLAVRVQQSGTVPAVLLRDARQKPRNVDQRHERDVNASQSRTKPAALSDGIDVKRTREDRRLLRNDSDAVSAEVRQADHDVRAQPGCGSKKSPSSTVAWISASMS